MLHLSMFLNLDSFIPLIYVFTNLEISIRFKLHLLLKDETGELPVMLLDTIDEHILGVSAEVLLDGSLEEVCISCS